MRKRAIVRASCAPSASTRRCATSATRRPTRSSGRCSPSMAGGSDAWRSRSRWTAAGRCWRCARRPARCGRTRSSRGSSRRRLRRARAHRPASHRRSTRAARVRRAARHRAGPGTDYELAWELAWHPSAEAFFAAHPPPSTSRSSARRSGATLSLTLEPQRDRHTAGGRGGRPTTAGPSGSLGARGRAVRRARVRRTPQPRGAEWHAPLPEIVRRRARYVLDHQRAPHRAGAAAGALVPIDTETGLTVPGAGWNDFSDARERIGMGLLLQQVLARGWGDDRDEVADAVARYRRFLLELVITDDGRAEQLARPRRERSALRPALAHALPARRGRRGRGRRARRTMFDRLLRRRRRHLPRDRDRRRGPRARRRPTPRGRRADADAVAERLIAHARGVLDLDAELPAHEVAYEQSMWPRCSRSSAWRPSSRTTRRSAGGSPTRSSPGCRGCSPRRSPAARAHARHRDPPLGRLLVRARAAVGRRVPPPLERADRERADAPPAGRRGRGGAAAQMLGASGWLPGSTRRT